MSEMDEPSGQAEDLAQPPETAPINEEFPVITGGISSSALHSGHSGEKPGDEPSGPPDGSLNISRRTLLTSAGAVVAAAAAGLGVGWSRNLGHGDRFDRRRDLPEPPAALVRAAQREADLIAATEAAQGSAIEPTVLAAVLADHRAHSEALLAALAGYRSSGSPSAGVSASSSGTTVPAPPTGAPDLRARETAAQSAAAADSLALSGAAAALLASISACEATHVVLLA